MPGPDRKTAKPIAVKPVMNGGGAKGYPCPLPPLAFEQPEENHFFNNLPGTSMKIAYVDCFSGVSGDMLLGAMLHAGVPENLLRRELKRLKLGRYRLDVRPVQKMHLAGCRITVETAAHHHAHRTFSDIRRLIRESALSPRVRELSISVFRRLAAVEADIHRTTPSRVHFHEVGAVDSIIDIVGTAIAIEHLGLDRIYASPLPLAAGLIKSQHGVIPLPAPASLALVRGVPVYGTALKEELVTPTGAALITTLAAGFGPMPSMRIHSIGYGAGSRELPDRPNLLRIIIGEPEADAHADQVLVMEANIDDMNPEFYDHLMERLFAAGALDVACAHLQMKKNRPGIQLQVICRPESKEELTAIVFKESTTSGIRYYQAERITLPRQIKKIRTPYGRLEVKIVNYPDGSSAAAPEYEQCKLIARRHSIPLKQVYLQIASLISTRNISAKR
jgi:hypothetical protein